MFSSLLIDAQHLGTKLDVLGPDYVGVGDLVMPALALAVRKLNVFLYLFVHTHFSSVPKNQSFSGTVRALSALLDWG
jgi:hypothetical protein